MELFKLKEEKKERERERDANKKKMTEVQKINNNRNYIIQTNFKC